jgi:hypothetical protein
MQTRKISRRGPEIRKLNAWLKANVPFSCKAYRKRSEIIIGADASRDLTGYAAAIRAAFGDDIDRVLAYGQKNYLTIIGR